MFKSLNLTAFALAFFTVISASAQRKGRTKSSDSSTENSTPYTLTDRVYKSNIKTVQLFNTESEMSNPAIELNSSGKIRLKFDDLDGAYKIYSYTFIHCDANWNQSNIYPNQYLDGFFQNDIRDYQYAVNTRQIYTNYTLDFPNQYVKFLASGNYILYVYENNNKEKPVITRRFFVYETMSNLDVTIRRSFTAGSIQSNQAIDVKATPNSSLKVFNPLGEFKLAVRQNRRWDNFSPNIAPNLLEGTTLVYTYNDKLNFQANNEFRQFDIRSIGLNSLNVRKSIVDTANQIFLFDDKTRYNTPFSNYFDINGTFAILQRDGLNSARDVDYAYVHFRLMTDGPLLDGEPYLMGALTNWSIDSTSKMDFDESCRCYYKNLYLKQGYYNYMYAVKHPQDQILDFSYMEGSNQQADNEYTLYFYFQSTIGLYDRLIGYQVVYSNQNK